MMDFSSQLRKIIIKSPLSVVSLAERAGIGQSTLYEALRNEYILSEDKTISLLDAIGVSSKIKKNVLRIREESFEKKKDSKVRRPSKAEKARETSKITDFLRRNGLDVSNDGGINSLLLVQVKDRGFPVLAQGELENREKIFGNALKCMLKTHSTEILVVSFIVEVPAEWEGIERHGIHLMNPNDALSGLKRLSEGKPLTESSNSRGGGSQIYF
jgi:hypothetical protein